MSDTSQSLATLIQALRALPLQHSIEQLLPGIVESCAANLPSNQISIWLNAILCSCMEGNQTPEQILSSFKTGSKQALCGYAFKHGDIAFNCRNCQVDDTCVQCMTCFQKSNHEGHDVYFHRTVPGGMCDCGDAEAWAKEGFCPDHGESGLNEEMKLESSSLPPSIGLIGESLIDQVIVYLAVTAQVSSSSFLPQNVRDRAKAFMTDTCTSPMKYHVRIFNDDIHSDDDLVTSLRAKGFDRPEELTRQVDSEGVATIRGDLSLEEAMSLMEPLSEEDWHVSVIDDTQLHREEASIAFISWMQSLTLFSPIFSLMISNQFSIVRPRLWDIDKKADDKAEAILSCLIRYGAYLPKPLVLALHELYKCLIGEKQCKILFSRLYIEQYASTTEQFLHGFGTTNEMIFQFGVQFFTTPSVVQLLVKEHLLEILVNCLYRGMALTKRSILSSFDPNRTLTTPSPIMSSQTNSTDDSNPPDPNFDSDSDLNGQPQPQTTPFVGSETETETETVTTRDVNTPSPPPTTTPTPTPTTTTTRRMRTRRRMDESVALFPLTPSSTDFQELFDLCQRFSLPSFDVLDASHIVIKFKRYIYIFRDLEYVLNIEHLPQQFILRERVLSTFLSSLLMTQGLNPQFRLKTQHIEFEKYTWIYSFNLHIAMNSIFSCVFNAIEDQETKTKIQKTTTNEKDISVPVPVPVPDSVSVSISGSVPVPVPVNSIDSKKSIGCRDQLESCLRAAIFEFSKEQQFELKRIHFQFPMVMDIIFPVYLLKRMELKTFHYPLFHFLARYLLSRNSENMNWNDKHVNNLFHLLPIEKEKEKKMKHSIESKENPENSQALLIYSILDCSLSVLRFASEIQAGYWARNGKNTMMGQMINYRSTPLCLDMRDLDLLLVQYCALYLTPSTFLSYYFYQYKFLSWCFPENKQDNWNKDPEKALILAEESLLNLIWLLTELPRPPLSTSSTSSTSTSIQEAEDLILQREIIHLLSEKPCVHSELMESTTNLLKGLGSKSSVENSNKLESILQQVAILREADESDEDMSPSKYELREEFMHEYDPSYYHLTRSQHEKAQSRRHELLERKRNHEEKKGKSNGKAFVSSFPLAHPLYEQLRHVLLQDLMFSIFKRLLLDALNKQPHKYSEMLMVHLIHLLTLQFRYLLTLEKNVKFDYPMEKNLFFQHLHEEKEWSEEMNLQSPSQYTIMELLIQLLKRTEDVAKETHAGIEWLVNQYALEDAVCQSYLKYEIHEKQKISSVMDEKAKIALRKKRQQEAMAAMLKRQQAFAQSMKEMEDIQESKDSMEAGNDQEDQEDEEILPDCIICTENTDQPLMYVGLSQRSGNLQRVYEEYEPFHGMSRCGSGLHLQLCGHALHLNCFDQYFASVMDRVLTVRDPSIGANNQLGEFLCPLCQTLSNVLVPHIPRQESTKPGKEMEAVFQTSQDPEALYNWYARKFPERIKAMELYHELSVSRIEILQKVMIRFTHTIIKLGTVVSIEDHMRPTPLQKKDLSCMERVHTLIQSVSYIISSMEMAGMSSVMLSTHYTTPSPSPKTCLGQALDSTLENTIDTWSLNDDNRLLYILNALKQIPTLFESAEDFTRAILEPLERQIGQHSSLLTWQAAVNTQTPLMLCQPFLSTDLLYLLILSGACFSEIGDILRMARLLCVGRLIQILIKSIEENVILPVSPTSYGTTTVASPPSSPENRWNEKIQSLELLRKTICEEAGLSISDAAPFGASLVAMVDTCMLPFLRQVMLYCRVLFRNTDKETIQYAVYANSLRFSTHYDQMMQQLGVPTSTQILKNEKLLSLCLGWSRQFGMSLSLSIPPGVRKEFLMGNLKSLKQRVETEQTIGGHTPLAKLKQEAPSDAITPKNSHGNSTMATLNELQIEEKGLVIKTKEFPMEAKWTNCYFIPPLSIALYSYPFFSSVSTTWGLKTITLIPLPHEYTDLHVKLSGRKCPSTGQIQENPAICIICGVVVCAGSDCCKVNNIGACTQHAFNCGYGTGIFFLLRKCNILLIYGSRSCYFASPYVDRFGEEDPHLRRGRPLSLNIRRLRSIVSLYANHQIANEVTRNRRTADQYIRSNFY